VSIAPETEVERYRVQELIGAGAMGEVFLAVDPSLGRKVALKILSDAHRDNPELRARFVREARAVAAISHPNVVQVFTTGEYDGRPYFAMEYLAGRDLGTIVREGGPLSSRAAAGNILDAARGLEAAAAAGLIHRDVKPSNLVRLDSGPVKVTDFGLAKPAAPTEDPALTALGVVVGTPDYIAPEQARGDEIDFRVDVYALGCTLFYLVTGRPPFRRGNEDDDKYLKVVARHIREPAPDARKLKPDVDPALAELALGMMRKLPDERPGYTEVIDRLEEVRGRLAPRAGSSLPVVRQTPSTPPLARPTAADTSTQPTREVPVAPRRSRWLWLTTGLSATVFLVGVGLNVFGKKAPAEAHPGPAVSPRAASDGGMRAAASSDGGPAADPHAGMLLARDDKGRAIVWVERTPVTNRAYAETVKGHRFAADDADRPVTGVSFEAARSYARQRGKRLLRADEWPPARDTLGFIPAGMRTWEWVDDGKDGKDRAVRRVPDDSSRKKAAGDKDVTFRLAEDG